VVSLDRTTAQNGIDPRDQLGGRERLYNVTNRVQAEPSEAVGLLRAGAEQHHGGPSAWTLMQASHDLESTNAAERHVEHDEIRSALRGERERLNPVRCRASRVSACSR